MTNSQKAAGDKGLKTSEAAAIATRCSYCDAGHDRTAETGGKTFFHVLKRGAGGQILNWQPCTRS